MDDFLSKRKGFVHELNLFAKASVMWITMRCTELFANGIECVLNHLHPTPIQLLQP